MDNAELDHIGAELEKSPILYLNNLDVCDTILSVQKNGGKMKIAICDDQESVLKHVIKHVESVEIHSEIEAFLSISDLYEKIRNGSNFNTVLMDIEWHGEQKGIEYASEIYKLSPKTKIIFVTGYPERYSQQIFLKNTNLKGFIQKPIDEKILLLNLIKIKDELILEENKKLVLKYNGTVVAVDPDDILYIESKLHTATVHSISCKHICYEKLDVIKKRLPNYFINTHKSFIVNMDKVQFIERERVILTDNKEVPISKSKYNEFQSNYFRYIRSII